MDNVICKADIKGSTAKVYKIFTIIIWICWVLFVLPVSGDSYPGWEYKYNILDVCLWANGPSYIAVQGYICIVIPLFLTIYAFMNVATPKQCELTLTDRWINGQRKKLFSIATLNLPMDKIDNIGVSVSLFNKLTGGKTVAIRSASGLIKFPWVQNADEFVEKALAEIEKYKNNASATQPTAPTTPQTNQSLTEKMTELKNLLEQGLLTQEEYDRKRQDLIDKM